MIFRSFVRPARKISLSLSVQLCATRRSDLSQFYGQTDNIPAVVIEPRLFRRPTLSFTAFSLFTSRRIREGSLCSPFGRAVGLIISLFARGFDTLLAGYLHNSNIGGRVSGRDAFHLSPIISSSSEDLMFGKHANEFSASHSRESVSPAAYNLCVPPRSSVNLVGRV